MKPTELKEKLSNGEELMLLDVREKDEFERGANAIEGSQNIPMGRVFVEAQKGMLPKDKKIVTICQTGGRCGIVARELRAKGYNIEELEGGIEGWSKE